MLREGVKHFTASAIILDEHDRILIHFHKKLQMWLYPGGHIEENEEPQEALLREVLEEVGVTPTIIHVILQIAGASTQVNGKGNLFEYYSSCILKLLGYISCQIQEHQPLDLDPASVAELPIPLTLLCEKIPEKSGGWHWHLDMIYLCILPASLINAEGEFKWLTFSEIESLPTPREFPSLIKRAISVKRSYSNI